MTWRDKLARVTLPDGRRLVGASFRGVPFFVEESERTGGRRNDVDEFPYKEKHHVEDMGKQAEAFSVEGYVLGDDYLDQRKALIAALVGTPGPGELVLPADGVLRAVCNGYSTRHSNKAGGMAVFQIKFLEAPAQSLSPTVAPDLGELVVDGAALAMTATATELAAGYSTDGLPSFAVRSASDYLDQVAADLEEALSPITMTTQELASLHSEVSLLRARATSLVHSPADTVLAFTTTLQAVAEATEEEPEAFVQALLDVYDRAIAELVDATTPTRARERSNQDALAAAIRRLLLIEAARLAPSVSYATHEDAVADREALVERLDEQIAAAGDDAYPALCELRARVQRALPGDDVLARIVTVERPVAIPSLLLAFQLYGTVDREAEVLARNPRPHPGFMAGTFKVLSE